MQHSRCEYGFPFARWDTRGRGRLFGVAAGLLEGYVGPTVLKSGVDGLLSVAERCP